MNVESVQMLVDSSITDFSTSEGVFNFVAADFCDV